VHVIHVITRLLKAGSEENTVATCLYQAKHGCHVTLVHGRDHHPEWSQELSRHFNVVKLDSLVHPIRPAEDIKALIALYRLFRGIRPEVVHTHQSKAGIVGRLAAAAAGVPAVMHTIHIAPFVNVTRVQRLLYLTAEKLCARVTDLFIPVSLGMRDAYLSEGIGKADMYNVIHSGMQLERFKSCQPPLDWRERIGGWSSAGRPKIILMLAAFEARKRHREFLRALAPRLCHRQDVCLLLAGDGPQRSQCEQETRQWDLRHQVRFLGHDSAPQELIALADLCMLTSEREGLPRVVVQYIASGKPVLLCPLSGIDELVRCGENGMISTSSDMDATVSEMFALLDDEPRLARLAAGAQSTDVSKWKEDVMGRRIEAAYRDVLSLRGVRQA
jgi:glycosyltransferase involved in cell wall biosynthesis